MDSDKILVMDAGSVKEYDHPYVLLQKEHGLLRTLVNTTGANTSKNLENVAKEVIIFLLCWKLAMIHRYHISELP